MLTKLIYENYPYEKEWAAKLVEVKEINGKVALIFDETIFYPEGGGQPFDQGEVIIDNQHYPIIEVQKENGVVYHYLPKSQEVPFIERDVQVLQKIDWNRRYEFMRWHSGEHLFSGIILSLFGSHNKGFHIGREGITCDYDRVFNDEEVDLIYRKVVEAILSNERILSEFPSVEALNEIEYRSKKEIKEDIRIVFLGSFDTCACCGTHVKSTSEIGPLKICGKENFKGGTRFNILFGKEASENYYLESKLLKTIAESFSTNISKVKDQIEKEKTLLSESREREAFLQSQLIRVMAKEYEGDWVYQYFPDYDTQFIKKLGETVVDQVKVCFFVCGQNGALNFFLQGESNLIADIFTKLKSSLSIKGGGRGEMISGKIDEDIERVFEVLKQINV